MTRVTILLLIFSITSFANAQQRRSIELDIIGRYDKHADYTTRYYDRTYTNDTKLWGLSYGTNLKFLQPLTNRLKLKIGVGYYKLVIDKVRQSTRVNTVAPARTIDYNHPTGIQPLFATSYYHYNNLALTGGLAYEGKVKKQWHYNVGGELSYLYTFSQLYIINYDNSKYRTHNGKTLGYGVNSYIGVIRRFQNDRYYINPKINIPIYQELGGDQVFGEDKNVKMDKWFNGGGVSFTLGKYL